jgi:hypothetical protein
MATLTITIENVPDDFFTSVQERIKKINIAFGTPGADTKDMKIDFMGVIENPATREMFYDMMASATTCQFSSIRQKQWKDNASN